MRIRINNFASSPRKMSGILKWLTTTGNTSQMHVVRLLSSDPGRVRTLSRVLRSSAREYTPPSLSCHRKARLFPVMSSTYPEGLMCRATVNCSKMHQLVWQKAPLPHQLSQHYQILTAAPHWHVPCLYAHYENHFTNSKRPRLSNHKGQSHSRDGHS